MSISANRASEKVDEARMSLLDDLVDQGDTSTLVSSIEEFIDAKMVLAFAIMDKER